MYSVVHDYVTFATSTFVTIRIPMQQISLPFPFLFQDKKKFLEKKTSVNTDDASYYFSYFIITLLSPQSWLKSKPSGSNPRQQSIEQTNRSSTLFRYI